MHDVLYRVPIVLRIRNIQDLNQTGIRIVKSDNCRIVKTGIRILTKGLNRNMVFFTDSLELVGVIEIKVISSFEVNVGNWYA